MFASLARRSLKVSHIARMATVAQTQPAVTPSVCSIKASSEEVRHRQLTERNLEVAVRHILQDGLVVVENAVDHMALDHLNKKMIEDAMTLRDRGKNSPFNYNRGNLQQDAPPVEKYFDPSIFLNPLATHITSTILGPNPKLTFCSGNTAMPPTEESPPQRQPVHSDADFAHPLHPFALVVNVPLIGMTPHNGSTEVWLGTHNNYGLDAQEGAHGERASGRIQSALLEERRKISPPIQPRVPKGSLIVRDLRLWHAGMPNYSDEVRVMLAMIHFAPWYRNQMRMEFGDGIKPLVAAEKGLDVRVDWISESKAMDTYLNRGFGNSYDFNQTPTCLNRKVKCDATLPTCSRCLKQGLFCDRSQPLRIRQHQESAIDSFAGAADPADLLRDPTIARLFHIYIKELAPWYDLNDSALSFGTAAPALALSSPLLFAAIIAFAGIYACRKYRFPITIAESYHTRCLQLLISLSPDDLTIGNGIALAATCLLRSYEILSEQEDPNRHLFGAFTLLPQTPSLHDRGLLPYGFWNYLREDITYSLVYECPLKVQVGICNEIPISDDEHANHITLLLAALINAYFGKSSIDIVPLLEQWKASFPAKPFSRHDQGDFPAIKMLKDCHVAAMHYYHVAMCMVKPEIRSSESAEICGLAMNAESDSVTVNAYGPICFSGRWLTQGAQRQALVMWLKNSQKRTSWSVEVLTSKLQQSWTELDRTLRKPHRA